MGKLATRTWARGVVTTYSYDPNTAEQTGISYSDGTPSLTYTFDRLGHGSSVVQAYSGFTLSTGLQYNIPGKMTQESFDSSYFAGRQLTYQLDTTNAGTLGRTIGYQVGTSSNPSSDQGGTFGYDSDGRLNSIGLSGGPSFTYAYTPNSNLIGSVNDTADNWSQSRTWDAHRDLLTTIQTSAGGRTPGSFSYVYDSLGRRTSKLETGDLFTRYPAAGIVESFSYDSRSEVTADQEYQSNNPSSLTTPILGRGFTYSYDPIGNRITSAVDAQQVNYTSNALNQIASRAVPGYYPASGFAPSGATVTLNSSAISSAQFQGQYYLQNVTANNSSSPLWITANLSSNLGGSTTANAFIPLTPETYTYDADGNILSDGRWNYFWDGENRLKAIETFGNQSGNSTSVWNSGVPRVHLDFRYDYQGRRISKAVSTWSGSSFVPSSETRFVYENWNLVTDYSVSGSALTLAHGYLWGIDLSGKRHGAGGVGGLLAMTASGSVEFPVYDANGNTQGLTDKATGQLTASYEYSPFGETFRSTGTYASVNPFQFSSKYTDSETRLIYYGHRYYNPTLGRFLGRDGIGEKGGLHLYAFGENDGINKWDSLGDIWAIFRVMAQWLGWDVTPDTSSYASQMLCFTPASIGRSGDDQGGDSAPPQTGTTTGALSPKSPGDPSWTPAATPSHTYQTSDGGKYTSVAGGTSITNPSNPGVYWADQNGSNDPNLLSGVGGALFSNLSWKTGADAAYYVAGTSNSITVAPNGRSSGDIEFTTGYGAIAYTGIQGKIPIVSGAGEPTFSMSGTIANGLALGWGADFKIAHLPAYTLPNGGQLQVNIPYPTQFTFLLGAGIGGEGKIDPPAGSANIVHVPIGEHPTPN